MFGSEEGKLASCLKYGNKISLSVQHAVCPGPCWLTEQFMSDNTIFLQYSYYRCTRFESWLLYRVPSLRFSQFLRFNLQPPNDIYKYRTAPLTSRCCILYIYSTNILTEYFKHAAHCPFFFSSSKCRLFHNATFFGSCIIHILNTGCAKT